MSLHQFSVEVVVTQAHGGTSNFRTTGTQAEIAEWLKQLAKDLKPKGKGRC